MSDHPFFLSITTSHNNLIRSLLLCILFLFALENHAYDLKNKKKYTWSTLPYILDDFMIIGSVDRNGIYMAKDFRYLNYATAVGMGAEVYYPLMDKAFLHTGLLFKNRKFEHGFPEAIFHNYWLCLPVFLAYELPSLKKWDLRFLVGFESSVKLNSSLKKPYSLSGHGSDFYYNAEEFRKSDIGLTFGLSIEKYSYYLRLRHFIGTANVMKNVQGSNHSYSLEFGYFIFRNLRNK